MTTDRSIGKTVCESVLALLATLVLLFGFQGEQIIKQPLIILLLAVPILIQGLEVVHIGAAPGDRIKLIAERAGTRPIEIAKALLVSGYRPEPME